MSGIRLEAKPRKLAVFMPDGTEVNALLEYWMLAFLMEVDRHTLERIVTRVNNLKDQDTSLFIPKKGVNVGGLL